MDYAGEVLLDTLVRPTRRIPRDAFLIHGISDEMVAGEPTWKEVWPQVEGILHSPLTGIYNAEFDLRMLQQSNTIHGLAETRQLIDHFCIMRLYAQFRGERHRGYGTYRWHSLETARKQLFIPLPNCDHVEPFHLAM